MARLLSATVAGCRLAHVSFVVTVEADGTERALDAVTFTDAVRRGDRFYLETDLAMSELLPAICPECSRLTVAVA